MTIKDKINSDLKSAMLSGDQQVATVLRGLKSVILNAEIAQGKREQGLGDETIEQLLSKEVKSRQESADIYSNNGQPDRATSELAEKKIIEKFLPEQMSDDELTDIIKTSIDETQASSMSDMGKVIGSVKSKVGSQAEGSRIADLVKEHLSK